MASEITWNDAAFAEISRSGGMQEALLSAAQSIADGANGAAYAHEGEVSGGRIRVTPYGASVDALSGTAVGSAHANHSLAVYLDRKHKCLTAQNH